MATRFKRKFIHPVEPIHDNGVVLQYEIEKAGWIWHPNCSPIEKVALQFVNDFELESSLTTTIHVSGDARYTLYLDGEILSRGPDRCDRGHWSFASYDLTLSPGKHSLHAEVQWLGDQAPAAQVSYRPGFILAAENLEKLLNTGSGNWLVAVRHGILLRDKGEHLQHVYHVIGPAFIIDGKEYFAEPEFIPAVVVCRMASNEHGLFAHDRHLFPTSIPEQQFSEFSAGRVRAANNSTAYPLPFSAEDETFDPALNFIDSTIEIPANQNINLLWDLENYYCAYPQLEVSCGLGAEISIEWAESLYLPADSSDEPLTYKGNRDDVAGKLFSGFGDTFYPSGEHEQFKSLWWRSGRYILISIKTAREPLTIASVSLETTRYPLENQAEFICSDKELETFIPIGVRGMQMCSHESLMDCPYYEQMMYVGDSRLELLTWYSMNCDNRFPQRCIELFDWSRWKSGFIAERYPSDPYQLSLTFSTIWIYMLHDFMLWRDDVEWLKKRLTGMRCLLENFRSLIQADGLLHALPGWSFVDWVDEWNNGLPPTDDSGIRSTVNLQFVYALQQAAAIERFVGEPLMAQRNEQLADSIKIKLLALCWNEEQSLMADNPGLNDYSEHAQCLALLSGTIPADKIDKCFNAMLNHKKIAKTTVYFSFYLFETFQLMNRGDLLLSNMTLWKELSKNGFKTTVEQPEPTRSDCHAWGAHPIFHFHATLAGIRPLEPGFKKLIIKPSPGNLEFLNSTLPHPNGEVAVELQFKHNNCHGTVKLPAETTGIFEWQGQITKLTPGLNKLELI